MSHWCCLVTRRSGPMGHVTLPCPLPVCWHLYFLCEMMCSKPKPPNPGPLPFLEAPSPACSPGRWVPSHKSSLCVQLPVLREAARHSFPLSGHFPPGSRGPGTGAVCGPQPPVWTTLARERTVESRSLYVHATAQEGVAAETRRLSQNAWPSFTVPVQPGLEYRVQLWAPTYTH